MLITKCEHGDLIPHVNWNTGNWYWTCNSCYSHIRNEWVTDKMRQRSSESDE